MEAVASISMGSGSSLDKGVAVFKIVIQLLTYAEFESFCQTANDLMKARAFELQSQIFTKAATSLPRHDNCPDERIAETEDEVLDVKYSPEAQVSTQLRDDADVDDNDGDSNDDANGPGPDFAVVSEEIKTTSQSATEDVNKAGAKVQDAKVREALERKYSEKSRLTPDEYRDLAASLNLDRRRVTSWFSRRRRRDVVLTQPDSEATIEPPADSSDHTSPKSNRTRRAKSRKQNAELNKSPLQQKGEDQFSCDQCEEHFSGKRDLNRHKDSHLFDIPNVCKICGKTFARMSNLKRHLQLHAGEKNHVCSVCNWAFAERSNLKRHMATHSNVKPFLCAICGYRCSHQAWLKIHMRSHTGEKRFACRFCDQRFSRSNKRLAHERRHKGEKKFVCQFCAKAFFDSQYLTAHMRMHTGERPYKCDVCGACFARRYGLRAHKELHTGEKRYKCRVGSCEARFTQYAGRYSHEKSHHKSQ